MKTNFKTLAAAIIVMCGSISAAHAVEALKPGFPGKAAANSTETRNPFSGASVYMQERAKAIDERRMGVTEGTVANEQANSILEGKKIKFEAERLEIEHRRLLDEEADRKAARAEELRKKKAERERERRLNEKTAVSMKKGKPAYQPVVIDARTPVPEAPVLQGVYVIDGVHYANVLYNGGTYRVKNGSIVGGREIGSLSVSGFDWGGRPVWNTAALNPPRVGNTDFFVGNDIAKIQAAKSLEAALNGEMPAVQQGGANIVVQNDGIQRIPFSTGTLAAEKGAAAETLVPDGNGGQQSAGRSMVDDLPPPPAYGR